MDDLTQQLRGLLQRAVVGAVDDTGDVQTVDLHTGDDVGRSLVEVHQPYGLSSLPPEAQPLTMVMAVGGDQGHQVALHLWSVHRFGKLAPGEVALYDWGGNRLHLKAGGNVDLLAAALLNLLGKTVKLVAGETVQISAGTTMLIETIDGLTAKGPVVFDDPVVFNQDVTFGADVTIAGTLTVGGINVGSLTASGTVTGRGASGRPL